MNLYSKKSKHTKTNIRKGISRYGGRRESDAYAEILKRDAVLMALDIFPNNALKVNILDVLCWFAQKIKNIEDIDTIAETLAVFSGSGLEGKVAELLKRSVIKDRYIVKDISKMLIDRKDLADASINIFPMLVYVYSNIEDTGIKRNISLHYLEDIVYACIAMLNNCRKIMDRYNEQILKTEFFKIMNKKTMLCSNLEDKIEKLDIWALSVSKDLRRYGFLFNRI